MTSDFVDSLEEDIGGVEIPIGYIMRSVAHDLTAKGLLDVPLDIGDDVLTTVTIVTLDNVKVRAIVQIHLVACHNA